MLKNHIFPIIYIIGFTDFFFGIRKRFFREILMCHTMDTDQMSILRHPLYEIFLSVNALADKKKGCTEIRIIKNRLRNNTILLLREKLLVFLGKKDKRQMQLLKDFRKEIMQRLKLHD